MGRKTQYGSDPKTIGTAGTGHKEGEATSSVFARMSGKATPATATPTASIGATPKTTATPKTGATPAPVAKPVTASKPAAAPAAKPAAAPAPGSFKAAYAKAREMGGSKAQFEFGGKKYQAAATKAEYVPMSQQKKVDIGSTTTGSTATATSKPAEPVKTTASVPTPPSRPAGIGTPAPAPVAPSGNVTPVGGYKMDQQNRAPSQGSTTNATPPSGGSIAPDAGRQSAPTDSGSSISVKPEPSSTAPAPKAPEPEKKKETGVAVENKLNECVQVGDYKYRII